MEQTAHPRSRSGRPAEDDATRTARLLLDDAIVAGACDPTALDGADARGLLGATRTPAWPVRTLQAAAKSRVTLPDFARDVAAAAAVRRHVLGDAAAGPPRFLVRVDEFPHYLAADDPGRYGTAQFRRFHAIMRDAGVPYLIAVPPRVSDHPLDPHATGSRPLDDEERALLAGLGADGVRVALHGRDHRTRTGSARRRSELAGLDPRATGALLDTALSELSEQTGETTRVFVPPYNRFAPGQWPALAERFAVVGGGPETIRTLGIQPTVRWRGDAVYLPAYHPLYARARDVLPAARHSVEQDAGLWTPIVLHWGWEADADWGDLERLARVIAPHTTDWRQFLAAVDRSR